MADDPVLGRAPSRLDELDEAEPPQNSTEPTGLGVPHAPPDPPGPTPLLVALPPCALVVLVMVVVSPPTPVEVGPLPPVDWVLV